jgi:hypothetical protein
MKLPSEHLIDALSLTRERVRVWVAWPLPDTRTRWRRRRIWKPGDFSRPACTLAHAFSRNLRQSIFSTSSAIHFSTRFNTLSRMGEGRVWDLGAQRIVSALRLKILMPGAKNRRQALRSHTPALSHPGEGVEPLASVDCTA